MLILSIETSCDETAISFVQAEGDFPHAKYEIIGDALWSQIDIHREYGGVFPALAKREHAAAIIPMLEKALAQTELETESHQGEVDEEMTATITKILEREPDLADHLLTFHRKHGRLPVDMIAVTSGPGLEPALWVGVNFARALALLWNTPVIPTNHMEGHILASIYDADRDNQLSEISFPAIALLISGGHTELVLMKNWGQYEKIGQTRDDAVGEAFDKVARLLGIPYPGGPEIARQAAVARKQKLPPFTKLPTPMLHSGDFDFSFSGLKTAVRYAVQDKVDITTNKEGILEQKPLTAAEISALARDFEDVVAEVLTKKTIAAMEEHSAQTLIVGGGVSANQQIKRSLTAALLKTNPDATAYFPAPGLSTDNSIMIALAGHAQTSAAIAADATDIIRANGNKSLA